MDLIQTDASISPGNSGGALLDTRGRIIGVNKGAVVLDVDQDGPAASAGVRPGDVIVGFADSEVTSVEDLLGALRGVDPGREASLTVMRDSGRQELTVTVGRREG